MLPTNKVVISLQRLDTTMVRNIQVRTAENNRKELSGTELSQTAENPGTVSYDVENLSSSLVSCSARELTMEDAINASSPLVLIRAKSSINQIENQTASPVLSGTKRKKTKPKNQPKKILNENENLALETSRPEADTAACCAATPAAETLNNQTFHNSVTVYSLVSPDQTSNAVNSEIKEVDQLENNPDNTAMFTLSQEDQKEVQDIEFLAVIKTEVDTTEKLENLKAQSTQLNSRIKSIEEEIAVKRRSTDAKQYQLAQTGKETEQCGLEFASAIRLQERSIEILEEAIAKLNELEKQLYEKKMEKRRCLCQLQSEQYSALLGMEDISKTLESVNGKLAAVEEEIISLESSVAGAVEKVKAAADHNKLIFTTCGKFLEKAAGLKASAQARSCELQNQTEDLQKLERDLEKLRLELKKVKIRILRLNYLQQLEMIENNCDDYPVIRD